MWKQNCAAIGDPLVREMVTAAIEQNLLPANTNRAYSGHFTVTADGCLYGTDSTWPGLDSWQMAGAYLLIGKSDTVLQYFDFVRTSQRQDGNIPFAVYPAETFEAPETRREHYSSLRYPEDVFTYGSGPDGKPRRWVGQYHHWVLEDPLRLLGCICYPLTAFEIFSATQDIVWLRENIASIERAARYLLTQKDVRGLIGGAGFYIEVPPRSQWDGITQCYCHRLFGEIAKLFQCLGDTQKSAEWAQEAHHIKNAFNHCFISNGHYGEYIHPEHGLVDRHGFTDVDFAAIAFGLADDGFAAALWERLRAEENFWWGGMPTQIVAKPYAYADWELNRDLPYKASRGKLFDIAATGRVWQLDVLASLKMGDTERLKSGIALVCEMGSKHGGFWHERYHILQDHTVYCAGPKGYCEYPAILTRTVLGNLQLFR